MLIHMKVITRLSKEQADSIQMLQVDPETYLLLSELQVEQLSVLATGLKNLSLSLVF